MVLGLVVFAWSERFIQDDAFISFRYADHLVSGRGLVWNPGERLEGYTNFLWTMLISLGLFAGLDPIDCAYMLGLFFFALSIITTFKISLIIFGDRNISLILILLLGFNYSFAAYATGGLETQMQTALLLLSLHAALRLFDRENLNRRAVAAASILFSLAILTRLDSGALVLPILIFIAYSIYKNGISVRDKIIYLNLLVLPMAIIIGAWFLWKLSYYGDILPNTFYVKASAITSPLKGLKYITTFLFSYLLFPLAVISIFAIRNIFKEKIFPMIMICFLIGCWMLYVIRIGGDFMEFRFLVPVIPLMLLLFCWTIFIFIKKKRYQAILVSLIMAGSVHHTLTFELDREDRIEPIRDLHNHLFAAEENWSGIGKSLDRYFRKFREVKIGVTAAGAIPYYSGLLAIDMYGLNDRFLAREGAIMGEIPGHQRFSPFRYLIDRGVNLVIAHPKVLKLGEQTNFLPIFPPDPARQELQTKVIEIPIDSIYKFLALYLIQTPSIDSLIQRNKWKAHMIALK